MTGQLPTIAADRVVFGLAEAQHGVVSRAQLLAAGLAGGAVEGRVARGALRVVHRGVYAVPGHPLTREGRWLAAVLACRGGVLSHWDAAELWEILRGRRLLEVHVSVPAHVRGRPRHGIRIHRAPLGAQTTTRWRIPVTDPVRTLFDLAPLLSRRRLERALDEARYLRLLAPGALEATLERNAGRTGAPALRAALATHVPGTTRTRSYLEERFLALCRAYGLPQPLINSRVAGLEVDFCWPDQRLVVETDGHAAHGRPTASERDHEREATLRDAGYGVRRFSYRQVTERPAWVAASVRRELGLATTGASQRG